MHAPSSFDKKGFIFALKCAAVLGILFGSVRYGTALAYDYFVDRESEGLGALEQRLADIKAARLIMSDDERQVREKLQEYESELATRSIDTASVQILKDSSKRMIAADLANMKLYLYENGHATATIDILSKGKRGSRWETPTGLYKIESREVDHFSTIGAVHMPYSLQFFGNFFVHGWPYYPGGDPVAEGFSGGCIRLSTEDAERVYDFAKIGTPIFVWEDAASTTVPVEIEKPPPRVSALGYIVADIATGEVYAERAAETPRPIASITKLITALVANETVHYDRLLAVSSDDREAAMITPGRIILNDVVTVGDALYALLMESNNSVAYTLARVHGMDNFVRWMNDKARAIGMTTARFDEPSGLSANDVASPTDLFRLMRYIHNSQSYILNVTRTPSWTVKSESGSRYTLANYNHYSSMPEFLGGKVGLTDAAKETMATVWEVPVKGSTSTATIAIIVLGSNDQSADILALFNWFKQNARIRHE